MKVRSVEMKYFKKFRQKRLEFTDPQSGLPKELIVLLGDNGSGKSTILQVLAAVLGYATKRLDSPSKLDWPGFDLELANRSWQVPGHVEVEVEFSQDEILATRDFYARVPGLIDLPHARPPGDSKVIKLSLERGNVNIGESAAERFQFMGREYAKQIYKFVPEGADVFKRVGGVFWYHEHRNATTLTQLTENGEYPSLSLLRQRLSELFRFHERVGRKEYKLRPGQRDIFAELERAYQAVFPNRHLEGPLPQTEIGQVLEETRFCLYDEKRQYELAEMSGGERAVFPLIFDFANWEIHNSVILIDELELHLHPPMQQALLRALQHLGKNNQFIISTHSDAVETLVPPEAIIRLELD